MGVVRMHQQWCPGRLLSTGSGLGTRLLLARVPMFLWVWYACINSGAQAVFSPPEAAWERGYFWHEYPCFYGCGAHASTVVPRPSSLHRKRPRNEATFGHGTERHHFVICVLHVIHSHCPALIKLISHGSCPYL